MDSVAFERAAMATYPTRVAWDAAAADLVHVMLERWHLTPGEAYIGGEAASVLRVVTREGTPAVLKVGFPHPEAIAEALALEAWGEDICPRVFRQDAWTWSLLLERVEPGIPLSQNPVAEALEVAAGLFTRFTTVPIPEGVPTLANIVGDYVRDAHGRLPGQRVELQHLDALAGVERALADAASLIDSDGGEYFLHGDFNPGNLLLSGSDRWLVIDPKPMRGDREFDLWPLVEQLGALWTRADPVTALEARFRLITDLVGCDYSRAVRWAVVRAALSVTWHVEDGNLEAATDAARRLRVVSEL